MGILKYIDFINEDTSSQLGKVICAVAASQNDHRYITRSDFIVPKYMPLFTRGDEPKVFDMPVINYCNIHIKKLMKVGQPEETIYNKYDAKMRVASKSDWHKLHESSEFVPKTATTVEDAKNLKFPIIAKPDNRYSGLGIVKFDTVEEFNKADKSKFSIYSEKVDIDSEHRIFLWRGEPIMWVNRDPANDKTKNMSKSADDKLNFNYALIKQDPPKEWMDVCQDFTAKHNDLDIFTVDFMVDKDGKPWVVEMSSEAGVPFGVMGHYYKKVYQDYYGSALSKGAVAILDEYIKHDVEATIKSDPKRFSILERYGKS